MTKFTVAVIALICISGCNKRNEAYEKCINDPQMRDPDDGSHDPMCDEYLKSDSKIKQIQFTIEIKK